MQGKFWAVSEITWLLRAVAGAWKKSPNLQVSESPSRKSASLLIARVVHFSSSFLPTADFLLLAVVSAPLRPAGF